MKFLFNIITILLLKTKGSIIIYDYYSGAGENELLMGKDKTDSAAPFDDHDRVVADASCYYHSTEIVSETQDFSDQLLMNNLLHCSHAYSSIDQQDSITETNLADSPFHIRSQEESDINGFRVKSRRNGRTRYGSDSLLTMILRERSRENAETAAAAASSKDASSLSRGGGQQSTLVGLPPEYENPSFSWSSPPLGGLLPFSGSIPRSGSISQRSNSTASTNSFAFPVLASEWNDSPVRMAEADKRRRLKKPRWWGICFICSRI